MNIPGQYREIIVFIHHNGFISALVEMPDPDVSSVVKTGVRDIEVAHEFRQVGKGRLNEQVKVIAHKHIAVKFDGVDVEGLIQLQEEAIPISIVTEDFPLVIATARYMIYGVVILNTKWPGQVKEHGMSAGALTRLKK
jgi:hypothetical protein